MEARAAARGWLVINETATPGFVERITRTRLPELLSTFDPKATTKRLTGASAPLRLGGATWETRDVHPAFADLRSQITLLTDILRGGETGLLITLDELHKNQAAELQEFATVIQHCFREERQIAFVGAGLTAAVSDILNDKVLTFLRRASLYNLGPVDLAAVKLALSGPITDEHRTIVPGALKLMAEGTSGYPFLIQLIGAHCWRQHPNEKEISLADALAGVPRALLRLGSLVHASALKSASEIDKTFLVVMAQDDGPSKMADIQMRMNVGQSYASTYRARLIAEDLIEPTQYGYIDFTLPYLREYLREHAASLLTPAQLAIATR